MCTYGLAHLPRMGTTMCRANAHCRLQIVQFWSNQMAKRQQLQQWLSITTKLTLCRCAQVVACIHTLSSNSTTQKQTVMAFCTAGQSQQHAAVCTPGAWAAPRQPSQPASSPPSQFRRTCSIIIKLYTRAHAHTPLDIRQAHLVLLERLKVGHIAATEHEVILQAPAPICEALLCNTEY